MEDSGRPSFRGGGGERRMEVVSGRGYTYTNNNNNTQIQMYNNYGSNSSTTLPVSPPRVAPTRPRQVAAKPWGFVSGGDSEMKRRKRIARYKAYSVEGRVKASIRNGFRWIKNKCSEIIHGY